VTSFGAPGASGGFSGLGPAGTMLSIAGMFMGVIGSFYSAKAQQYQLKSQALSMDFEASMANLNARSAELDAQHILESGQQELGLATLRAGQAKAAQAASLAARGVQAGVGTAAELQATTELAKQLDVLTINSNAVRAAEASRTRGIDFQNRALLAGVSARNLRGAARSVRPWMSGFSSLLGGASGVASQWAANQGRSY